MILLKRTRNSFGAIDGSSICADVLARMSIGQIRAICLSTETGLVACGDVFEVSTDPVPNEPFLVIQGDCGSIHGLGTEMQSGTMCILGNAGDNTGRSMGGGALVIFGDAKDHLGSDMNEGLIYVTGNCRHGLASPREGKKSGMRGGDILVASSVGDRACERMRRGTVFVAGDAGDYSASQMIAGSLVVMGEMGSEWAGGMRRGSLILGRDCASHPSASLSDPRDFELSFLPLIWRHIEALQNNAFAILQRASAFASEGQQRPIRELPLPFRIPRTRWVQRRIADLNCQGRGEVLVLKRVSSLDYRAC